MHTMKTALSAFLLVMALAMLHPTAADDGMAAPRVVVDNPSRSFGTIKRGEAVNIVFTLQNIGTAPLKFERIEFSRPDMNIQIRQEILPGESADATVLWNTSRFSGDYDGEVILFSNDPNRPVLSLNITGKVISPFTILPRPALYLSQFEGQESSQFLEIRNNQSKDVKITDLEKIGSHYETDLSAIEEGRRYRVKVSVPAEVPVGKYEERVVIHTDDPLNPRLYAAINVLVKSSVHLSSQHVDLGTISMKDLVSKPGLLEFLSQTVVINRKQGEMRITNIDSDLDFLQISADPGTPSSAFTIDIRPLESLLEPGPIDGRILLTTDDPEFETLSITVSGKIVP